MPRVLGVDACKKGWVGITNDSHGYFGSSITDLMGAALQDGSLDVIAIDIPIGLPNTGPRQADALARKLIGRRASSVFPTPVRAALAAASHTEATAISVQSTGKGLSQQAYALRKKILEVDDLGPVGTPSRDRATPRGLLRSHEQRTAATPQDSTVR